MVDHVAPGAGQMGGVGPFQSLEPERGEHGVEAPTVILAPPALDQSLTGQLAGAGTGRTLYLVEGSVMVDGRELWAPVAVRLRPDAVVELTTGTGGASALLLQGRPIGEPLAMGGPFVMNTREEIDEAYRDFHSTGFGGWPWTTPDPVHPRSTPRFAHHPDGRTEYPEGDDR